MQTDNYLLVFTVTNHLHEVTQLAFIVPNKSRKEMEIMIHDIDSQDAEILVDICMVLSDAQIHDPRCVIFHNGVWIHVTDLPIMHGYIIAKSVEPNAPSTPTVQ